jgi:hypothetical protein
MVKKITIPLITMAGLRKLVEICTKNKIDYQIEDCEDPYKVLIPEPEYRIWGLDQKEFE